MKLNLPKTGEDWHDIGEGFSKIGKYRVNCVYFNKYPIKINEIYRIMRDLSLTRLIKI